MRVIPKAKKKGKNDELKQDTIKFFKEEKLSHHLGQFDSLRRQSLIHKQVEASLRGSDSLANHKDPNTSGFHQ